VAKAVEKDTPEMGKIYAFPDIKPSSKRDLLGKELGTQFDLGQRLFAWYGEGDVFDYGEYTARDMKAMFRRDGICSAVESVLTLPIREADFSIEAAKGDQGEADFARSVILTPDTDGGMKTPSHELIGQVTSAQIYRRAFFEKVWKVRESDGMVIYDKVAFRPPATCQARYNSRTAVPNGFRQQVWLFGGNLMLTKEQKVPGYVDIPKVRSFIHTHGKHREPLSGVSEMDVAYWVYQTKMKLLFLWYYFLENQAMQRIVAYGNDQPEANVRADDIAALRGSGVVGLVHPPDGKKAFDVITAGTNVGEFFSQAMMFLEGWQTQSVLAGFMGLVGGATAGKGAYSLSQDQSAFYLKSRQAVAKEIAESLSYDILRPLVLLNYGPAAAFPTWRFGPLQDEQLQSLLTLFGQLAAAPVLHVPMQVFDLITERMASILQLDIDQVHTALVSTAQQRAEQLASQPPPGMPASAAAGLGQVQGLVGAAQNLTQQAARRQGGVPEGLRGAPAGPPAPPPAPSRLGAGGQGPPRPPQ
jgi:hypothetical protein